MDVLYIVVPAYNESAKVEKLVEDWYPIVEKYNGEGKSRMVVIDDGSKDNTYELLIKLSEKRPLLLPLTKPNGGHGATLLYGYRYAIKEKADYIFQTDSDGQTSPDEFHEFWNKREKNDAIIGNRTDRKDGLSRIFVEKVLCFMLRIFYGVKIPDSNAPFRLMRTDCVDKYLPIMPDDYNLPNVILTTCFKYFDDKLVFIPITFKPRQGGKNSINIKKICKIGVKAVKDFKNIRQAMKK